MGLSDVTAWAKKRLAEGADGGVLIAPKTPAIAPPPAPAQPSPEAAPAPQKASPRWCGADQQPPAIEAIDQAPPTPKKPLALDPGERALLALAMAFCDRTAASDKARAQWVDDVESTPNELRADLYAHLHDNYTSKGHRHD